MRHCDLVLLSVFMVEICLRLFGFGRHYLRDCINVVDAVVRRTQASNHPGLADPDSRTGLEPRTSRQGPRQVLVCYSHACEPGLVQVVLVSWVITLLPPSMVKLFAWF